MRSRGDCSGIFCDVKQLLRGNPSLALVFDAYPLFVSGFLGPARREALSLIQKRGRTGGGAFGPILASYGPGPLLSVQTHSAFAVSGIPAREGLGWQSAISQLTLWMTAQAFVS